MTTEAIEAASEIGVIGLDPILFLTTKDETLRQLMMHVSKRIYDKQIIIDRNRAAMIAEAVSKLFKK